MTEFVFGRFTIRDRLGEGATGVVYRAYDDVRKCEVALKILKPEVTQRVSLDRFRNQFYLVAQLNHPAVVPHLAMGIEGGSVWLATKLLEGETLSSTRLPPREAARMICEIAGGLEFIHAHGALHLDLKPSNIFVSKGSPLLMDFGLAESNRGGICGTPEYMAPEVIRREYYDSRADLYSLGVIALELLTGKNPFSRATAAESLRAQLDFIPKIPKLGSELAPFESILGKLLDKDPFARPPSAYSVRFALQEMLGIEPIPAEGFFLPKGPFIGRRDELDFIKKAWLSGDFHESIAILGADGVGKTALCERAINELALEGALTAEVSSSGAILPALLAPFLSAEYSPIVKKYLPPLIPLVEGELPKDYLDALGLAAEPPLESGDVQNAHIARFLEELTAQTPLVVHFRAPVHDGLLKAVADSDARVLALLDGFGEGRKIELSPLDTKETAEFVRGLFGPIDEIEALSVNLHERSSGNPAGIRAEALGFVKNGALEPRTESWHFAEELARFQSPFKDRWRVLNVATQRLCAFVAISGEIEIANLQALVGREFAFALYKALSSGMIGERVTAEQTAYFPSQELRQNISKVLSSNDLAMNHCTLAERILESSSTTQSKLSAARHFEAGLSTSKAAKLYFEVGTEALKKIDYPTARNALEAADRLSIVLVSQTDKVKCLKRLALARKNLGDFEGARESYYRANALAESADSTEQRASITGDIGVTFFEQGNTEKALEYYRRAHGLHDSLGNEKGALIDLVNIAGALQVAGEFGPAREAYIEATAKANLLENHLCLAAVKLNLGEMSIADNDLASALQLTLESAAIAREHSLENILFQALLLISQIHRLFGNSRLAAKSIDEAERAAASAGKRGLSAVAIERAAVMRFSGEYSSARASLNRAAEMFIYLGESERERFFVEAAMLSAVDGLALPRIKRVVLPEGIRDLFEVFSEAQSGAFEPAISLIDRVLQEPERVDKRILHEFYIQKSDILTFKSRFREALDTLEFAEGSLPFADPFILGRILAKKSALLQQLGDLGASRSAMASSRAFMSGLDNTTEIARQSGLLESLSEPARGELSLRKLLPILKALNSTLDSRHLLRKILDSTLEATGSERVLLFLVEKGSAELEMAISADGAELPLESARFSHGLVEYVMKSGNARFVGSVGEDASLSSRESVIDLDLSMALCVPISTEKYGLKGLIYADARIGKGAFDERTLDFMAALGEQAAIALRNAELFDDLRAERDGMARAIGGFGKDVIIGKSKVINELREKLSVIAAEDISLLITGETGTGKDLIARTIHSESARRNSQFIAINCAAIPENLIESELFGHERGAFTGADKRQIGKFELANGGTLFLDEIGEMPIALQVKLLRVLESRSIQRLGGDSDIPVDVRIIAATNLDITEALKTNILRKDLYYRIAPITVNIPPLREHPDDIPLLAYHYIEISANKFQRKFESITNTAISALTRYPWPGNVRELIGVIEEAVIFASTSILRIDDLPLKIARFSPSDDGITLPSEYSRLKALKTDVAESFERDVLIKLLKKYNWKATDAAKAFKIDRSRLQQLMKKYNIEKERQ